MAAPRTLGQRTDSRRTRQQLLAAVGELVNRGEGAFNLGRLAQEAGVSSATAYRYFGSADEAVRAYVLGFPAAVALEFERRASSERGVARLALFNSVWIELLESWGTALNYLRSPEGFLARRARGEPMVAFLCSIVEPILAEVLDELSLTASRLPFAVFTWNLLIDPRDILDLRTTLGWSRARVEKELLHAFLAMLSASEVAEDATR